MAACVGFVAYRHEHHMFRNLAVIFLIAAVGSVIIIFFAESALR